MSRQRSTPGKAAATHISDVHRSTLHAVLFTALVLGESFLQMATCGLVSAETIGRDLHTYKPP